MSSYHQRNLFTETMSDNNNNNVSDSKVAKRAKPHRSMEAAWSYLLYLEEDSKTQKDKDKKAAEMVTKAAAANADGTAKLEITANGITSNGGSNAALSSTTSASGNGPMGHAAGDSNGTPKTAEGDGDSKPDTDEIPVDHQLLHLNDGAKLFVCMVGKPARGKTFLAAKLQRYLEWLDYRVKHVDTVAVRQKMFKKVKPDDFFDPHREETKQQRRDAHEEALKQSVEWLQSGGQAVIYDASNSTRERRKWIADYIEKNLVDKTENETVMSHRILWVESVCDNQTFIVQNFLELRKKNPDFCEYKELDDDSASLKFLEKLKYHDDEYETLDATKEDISFIRLLDFGQSVLVNKIHGFIESKLVSFCMNIHMEPRVIILMRHGQSEFNLEDRIGGDPDLTEDGKLFAKNLAKFIDDEAPYGLQPHEEEDEDDEDEDEENETAAAAAAAATSSSAPATSASVGVHSGAENGAEESTDKKNASPAVADGDDNKKEEGSNGVKAEEANSQEATVEGGEGAKKSDTPAANSAGGSDEDNEMGDEDEDDLELERLKAKNPYAFDPAKDLFVWTSILQRTLQTVQHIKCRATVSWVSLSEIDAGVCECMTYKEFREQLATQFMKRQRNKATWRYPGGESYLDVKKRLEPVIFELERQRKPVLVCAHRAVIRCLYSYFCGIPITKAPFLPVPLHTALVLTPTSHGWTETRTPIEPSVGDLGAHELKNKDHDVHAAAAKIRKSQAKKRRLELQAKQEARDAAARVARQKLTDDTDQTTKTASKEEKAAAQEEAAASETAALNPPTAPVE